jgi:hypothetical protein
MTPVLRLSTKHVARLGSFETSVDKLQVQAISKGQVCLPTFVRHLVTQGFCKYSGPPSARGPGGVALRPGEHSEERWVCYVKYFTFHVRGGSQEAAPPGGSGPRAQRPQCVGVRCLRCCGGGEFCPAKRTELR